MKTLQPVIFKIRHLKRYICNSVSCKQDVNVGDSSVSSRRNPLGKVKRSFVSDNAKTTHVSRISIAVVGNGAIGQPQCLCMFTDHKCYMFNCGEGSTRILLEQGLKFVNAKHIFVTEKSWRKVAGLSDLYLSQNTYGVKKITLHGPPKVEDFTNVMLSTMQKMRISKKNAESSPYADDTFEIEYVPIDKKKRKSVNRESYRRTTIEDNETDQVFSYICKIKTYLGDFSVERCIDMGVPLGPFLLKLKNGEDVTLPSGKVVRSLDVHENSQSEVYFLVVDCPFEAMIDEFINDKKLERCQSSNVWIIFHFSPSNVVNSFKYQNWIHKFRSSVYHVFLNTNCSTMSSAAVHELQEVLHMLHPGIFPLLHEKGHVRSKLDFSSNFIPAEPNLQFHLRPQFKIDRSAIPNLTREMYRKRAMDVPNFSSNLAKLHEAMDMTKKNLCKAERDYPEVIFLGTSSSTSTTYRNVTSILVQTNANNIILLDCGEGTYMQLMRHYGYNRIDSVLQKISCVFLSHHHVDHYMGCFELLKARRESFASCGRTYIPLAIVTNPLIDRIFKTFHRSFEHILKHDVRIFLSHVLLEDDLQRDALKSCLMDVELQPVPVTHCSESYGVVLHSDNWKIVYSGDCAPSQTLVDAGRNCDLLIHEASIEDGFSNEAAFKKHSTPSQVIDVAENMNAEHIILTHFSKRYLVAPYFPEAKNVGCAFDNMAVKLHHLPLLPLFVPTLKSLFSDLLEQHQERSAITVNFERAFFRTVRNNGRLI